MSVQSPAMQQYREPRADGEINLIAQVRQLLVNAGLENAASSFYDSDANLRDALNRNAEVQRYWLNRYWNLQLMNCRTVSVNERFCLIPNGSVDDWLRLFTDKVLPFIVKNQLPTSL